MSQSVKYSDRKENKFSPFFNRCVIIPPTQSSAYVTHRGRSADFFLFPFLRKDWLNVSSSESRFMFNLYEDILNTNVHTRTHSPTHVHAHGDN